MQIARLACPTPRLGLTLRHHDVRTGIGHRAEPLMGRPDLTQIRVHELASELKVSTQEVQDILQDLGTKVRGPSTVIGDSAAGKVRIRLRAPKAASAEPRSSTVWAAPAELVPVPVSGGAIPAARTVPVAVPVVTQVAAFAPSLFLPPVAPPAAVTMPRSTGIFSNPFAVPVTQPSPAATRPVAAAALIAPRAAVSHRVPPVAPVPAQQLVIEEEPDWDAMWQSRDISKIDQESWIENGLRESEAELADRCLSAGIAPEDLGRKLSGRTTLQRLRDGEASMSVWARLREAEQQPRRAGTKLTGRFS